MTSGQHIVACSFSGRLFFPRVPAPTEPLFQSFAIGVAQ